jgi:hypothetical protein
MPDINEVFGGETLKATDLQGREFTLAMASVQAKEFDKGAKLVIKFVGAKKALIANRTNSKRIAMLYGNNTDLWIGRQITLYAEMVDFKGEATWAIRVKQPPAPAAMPGQHQPTPTPQPVYVDPDPMPPLDRDMNDTIPF